MDEGTEAVDAAGPPNEIAGETGGAREDTSMATPRFLFVIYCCLVGLLLLLLFVLSRWLRVWRGH